MEDTDSEIIEPRIRDTLFDKYKEALKALQFEEISMMKKNSYVQ